MQASFTFCGDDIEDIGLQYAPELTDTYVYKPAAYDVQEESVGTHNGGYYYGTTTQPKEFVLRCIFEDQFIKDGVLAKVNQMFRRGKTGRLVFTNRPWIWYLATVVNINTDQLLNFDNGYITISMKAYYPFARSDYNTVAASEAYADDAYKNSGFLSSAATYPDIELATTTTPITASTSAILYNPGTERAAVAVEIAGDVGEGVVIANGTTGQKMRFVGITTTTIPSGYYLITDALSGKTIKTNGTTAENAFLYHDYGFIELEPSFPIVRDIKATYSSGSTSVTVDKELPSSITGKYIYLDSQWRKIAARPSSTTITVTPAVATAGTDVTTNIVTMNEIQITPTSTMNLTRLKFVYKPTFA